MNIGKVNTSMNTTNCTVFSHQPQRQLGCSMMFLTNLAEPKWISIECNSKLLAKTNIFCSIQSSYLATKITFQTSSYCPRKQIVKDNVCYVCLWKHTGKQKENKPKRQQLQEVVIDKIDYFLFILLATAIPISPVLAFHSSLQNLVKVHTYDIMLNVYNTFYSKTDKENVGFWIKKGEAAQFELDGAIFQCKSATITHLSICDKETDCPHQDMSDEENCTCSQNNATFDQLCAFVNPESEGPRCSALFYLTKTGKCQKYFEIDNHTVHITSKRNKTFECDSGQTVDMELIDDLIPDCLPEADDELLLRSLTGIVMNKCIDRNQISCLGGHTRCYHFSAICTYKLNKNNNLVPCRNGAHLENCKGFECSALFKCVDYYCLPWAYVCDTKWDCPTGHDESKCSDKNRCDDLLKCKGTYQTCIHLGNLCDGERNCPSGDDEVLCELKRFVCPPVCVCLALSIVCSKHASSWQSYYALKSYPFLAITFQFLPEMQFVGNFHKLSVLKIESGNITDVCGTIHVQDLRYLEIRQNPFTTLKKDCIQNLPILKVINFRKKSYREHRSQSLLSPWCFKIHKFGLQSFD